LSQLSTKGHAGIPGYKHPSYIGTSSQKSPSQHLATIRNRRFLDGEKSRPQPISSRDKEMTDRMPGSL
jgi:hypothetical protein